MAEEQKWQEPSNHVLCANNCGFFGSPTTLNLCSKCYKDHCLKEQHISTAITAVENTLTRHQEPSSCSRATSGAPISVLLIDPDDTVPSEGGVTQQRSRCGCCRRRVGLTGFTCKCRMVFCGVHRYPEEHKCSYDYKTVGKEVIARENPVVKGVKLEKI